MSVRILQGDCRDVLRTMEAESVHMVCTSPPYWGLRDYGIPPVLWDDDPDCDHVWGEQIAVNATNHTGKARWNHTRNGRDEEQPIEKRVSWLRTNVKQGSFCQKCGAWLGSLGLEPTYQMFVDHMVEVFREVWRVLRPDGVVFLNLGDSYASGAGKVGEHPGGGGTRVRAGSGMDGRGNLPIGVGHRGRHQAHQSGKAAPRIEAMGPMTQPNRMPQPGLKPKDLCGIPWRVAFALQDAGWWLRQDIIWHKLNPMPESVTDRCTKAHEYVFLLSKSERYYWDQDAIKEEASANTHARLPNNGYKTPDGWDTSKGNGGHGSFHKEGREAGYTGYQAKKRMGGGNKSHKGTTAYEEGAGEHRTKAGLVDYSRKMAEAGSGIKNNESMDEALAVMPVERNKRSVWSVATAPFSEAHFATFPPALVEPCILAGCPKGGVVCDPFFGAGTVGLVADRLGRNCIGIDLNPSYVAMAKRRIVDSAPLLVEIS
jgi:DNA modification methylase